MVKLHWCPLHNVQPDKCCEKAIRYVPMAETAYQIYKRKKKDREFYQRHKERRKENQRKYTKRRWERVRREKGIRDPSNQKRRFLATVIKRKKKPLEEML